MQRYKQELAVYVSGAPFNLIELGPGEGIKTQVLVQEFLKEKLNFKYVPIDISPKYLHEIMLNFRENLPRLEVEPIIADYFQGIKWQCDHSGHRNLVLFLGSSIGNFNHEATLIFLQKLKASLRKDDLILMGFDLIKDDDVLKQAYNDSDGLTRDFNLNHLRRINNELGGSFNLNDYTHHAAYNANLNAMESFLISNKTHDIRIAALNKTYSFKHDEPIHMEFSHKYNAQMIESYAKTCGFKVLANYSDKRNYYLDSLWQVV